MTLKPRLEPIREDLILERMNFENPWWITGSIDEELNRLQRRTYFKLFLPLAEEKEVRRAVVLMGPRRVGKTVLMQHVIEEMLEQGINRRQICYLGVDNPIYLNMGLENLFKLARKATGNESAKGWYVFFDEIQYLKNWEVHLKVLVDSYPHCKFIVSGSASAALKLKSVESGAGRFTDFFLPPLTFHEYIQLKGLSHILQRIEIAWKGNLNFYFGTGNIKELNKYFIDYINFGGYPEIIFRQKTREDPGRYIKSDIVDKVLLRDLPSLYGIQDIQELNSFFSTLAYYSGNEVSLEALSQSSGVEKNLLKKYLTYLEAAFLIKVVHRIDDSAKKFKRAAFYKIYLTNPSLRSALFTPLDPVDESFGSMVETAVFSQWMHSTQFTPLYARWRNGRIQGEVDMIGLDKRKLSPVSAVEIKWSNRYCGRPKDLKSLLYFCKKNNIGSALVTTIDKTEKINQDGFDIYFYPASLYAYSIGANIVE